MWPIKLCEESAHEVCAVVVDAGGGGGGGGGREEGQCGSSLVVPAWNVSALETLPVLSVAGNPQERAQPRGARPVLSFEPCVGL